MQPLYDAIGSTYCATRRADPEIASELARLVGASEGLRYLDVACGAGNYTSALAALGGQWHGVDISEVMLGQAMRKAADVEWKIGSATALPYEAGLFDGAICSLAIHHFPELEAPFREAWRVLDEGRFVIFTAFPEQMHAYWLCRYFPEMMRRSAEKMPAREAVVSALRAAKFDVESIVPFHVTARLQDLFLYSGKARPELYFDPAVRANISSFASLCTDAELHDGLRALRADLDSGRFAQVAQAASSSGAGDYVFVVARKPKVGD